MRLFLDASVLLAACGSAKGASREIFRLASAHGWRLIAPPYLVEEVLHNLPLLPANATSAWGHLRVALTVRDDVLTLDRAAIFPASKEARLGDDLPRVRVALALGVGRQRDGAEQECILEMAEHPVDGILPHAEALRLQVLVQPADAEAPGRVAKALANEPPERGL